MKLTKKQLRYIISESLSNDISEKELREGVLTGVITAAIIRQLWKPTMVLFKKYLVMRNANTKYSDKYFHCLAHSEAVKSSLLGEITSEVLGTWREQMDSFTKGDSPEAVAADYFANNLGRISGKVKGNGSLCWKLIPNGLSEEYWVLPAGLSIDVAKKHIEKNTEQNPRFMRLQGEEEKARAAETDYLSGEPHIK